MSLNKLFGWFVVNVLAFSVPLAIYEIVSERNHGWGTALGPFWGKHFFEGTWFAHACEKEYFTLYHLVMFCAVIPLCLGVEYLIVRTMHPLFFIASWLEICVVEDLLWFVMNWHYKNSLRELLAGRIWWHKVYWHVGNLQFPRFYVLSSLWAIGALFLQYYLES